MSDSQPSKQRPLEGKTALITGGGRGIGRGIAKRLAADGALVAVNYATRADAADETVAAIESAGGSAFPIGFDIRNGDPKDLMSRIDAELTERVGDKRLDILINNAAYANPTPFEDITPELFDAIFETNVRGHFFLTQAALERIPDGGRIVTIGSSTRYRWTPGSLPYTMGKGALETMDWFLAKYLGPRNITVNTVAPGLTKTELAEQVLGEEGLKIGAAESVFNRVGDVDDVADVVAYVVSHQARWITGQVFHASGGSVLV